VRRPRSSDKNHRLEQKRYLQCALWEIQCSI
jgi:hypothetical protein